MRYNIDEIVLGTNWLSPLRFLIYFNPYYWRLSKRKLSRGARIRLAIERLGPIFVKMGQLISTRIDLIPEDIAVELAKLQDRVPPFSGKLAQQIIESALQQPVHTYFTEFSQEALASASIAQVHTARLLVDNTAVVIKVLRPNIRQMIDRDLDLLRMLANIAQKYFSQAKHFKPKQLVEEIATTLYDELDLTREGANAAQLRRNFSQSNELYVPKIYWQYCRNNVLVMERIYGIPIYDIKALQQAQFNLQKLAERCINIFLTQVFRDSFFHADLHPGNIFISAHSEQEPAYIIVDFGIVGSLSHADRRYLAENMLAFFKRDYQRVAELHIACGWLPPDTRIDLFAGAIRAVSEPIFEQPLRDISFGKLLLRLFQVARRFDINIQPQLILLQKTLLNVEGISRQLAPDLDLWATASPQIENWLRKQMGPRAFLKRIAVNLPLWSRQFPAIPSLIYEVLQETKYRQERERFTHLLEMNNSQRTSRNKSELLFYFLLGAVAAIFIMMLAYY